MQIYSEEVSIKVAVLTSYLNGNPSLTDVASVKQHGSKHVACLDLRCSYAVVSHHYVSVDLMGYFSADFPVFLFTIASKQERRLFV